MSETLMQAPPEQLKEAASSQQQQDSIDRLSGLIAENSALQSRINDAFANHLLKAEKTAEQTQEVIRKSIGHLGSVILGLTSRVEQLSQIATKSATQSAPTEPPTQTAAAGSYSDAFFNQQAEGSIRSARCVLTEVASLHPFRTVLDIGCGVGGWLRVALELGAASGLGVDGAYVPLNRLMVHRSLFRSCDLEKGNLRDAVGLQPNFDLVMCMEVAEHLPPSRARSFVAELCSLGDLQLFSAAIPGQGGTHHVNEQWPDYWIQLFRENGFDCFDLLRPRLWSRTEVEWWYAQNAFLFARRGSSAWTTFVSSNRPIETALSVIHPRMHKHYLDPLSARVAELERTIGYSPFGRDDQIRQLEAKVDGLRGKLHESTEELRIVREKLAR